MPTNADVMTAQKAEEPIVKRLPVCMREDPRAKETYRYYIVGAGSFKIMDEQSFSDSPGGKNAAESFCATLHEVWRRGRL